MSDRFGYIKNLTADGCECHDDVICASHQDTFRCRERSPVLVAEGSATFPEEHARCEMWRGHGKHHVSHQRGTTLYWSS